MADQMDRFYDLLSTQGEILRTQGLTLAEIRQAQTDMKGRLFGEGNTPGIIPYLADEHKRLDQTQKDLGKELSTITSDRRADKAYIMGGAAVLTLFVKAALNKIGLHF